MSRKRKYVILPDTECQRIKTYTEARNYLEGNGIEWEHGSYLAWKAKELDKPNTPLYCLKVMFDLIYTEPPMKIKVITKTYSYSGTDCADELVSETFNLKEDSPLISVYCGRKIR